MRTDLFDYYLPPEQIAQTPLPRGTSRLMVVHRATGTLQHRQFRDILDYVNVGDTLVLNDTRVSARRVTAERENGSTVEVLLLAPTDPRHWNALLKPARRVPLGKKIVLLEGDARLSAEVVGVNPDGSRQLAFETEEDSACVAAWGTAPLPPYIGSALNKADEERYQTVYSVHSGSAAAPTAGLHFTPEILAQAAAKGVQTVSVTLHIGIDTFRPVKTEDTDAHEMHGEFFSLSAKSAQTINATKGKIIAIGTTSVRVLETAARLKREQQSDTIGRIMPYRGNSHLFLTPGSPFYATDALLTNFHLPRSTLLMLVSAFATRELILEAYRTAVESGYRFFSFGDAMLIL